MFHPATRHQLRGRVACHGPAGSGKTLTSLLLANRLGRTAVISTEAGAVEKYAGLSCHGCPPLQFDVATLPNYHPDRYCAAIHAAIQGGYNAVVIDSLSHAWEGTGGALELVDQQQAAGGNKFRAWGQVTPLHKRLIETILQAPIHILATMRTKTEYVVQPDERGKYVPHRVGLAPIQRAGVEYEFDLLLSLDADQQVRVDKTRCPEMPVGTSAIRPGPDFFAPFLAWLSDGEPLQEVQLQQSPTQLHSATGNGFVGLCSADQAQRIWNLLCQLAGNEAPQHLAGMLARRQIDDIRQMHAQDADNVIANLMEMLFGLCPTGQTEAGTG